MACRIELSGEYEVRVLEGQALPSAEGGSLRVGIALLEADARYGLLGESIAGALLPPLRIECNGDLEERVHRAIQDYRSRVVVEQAYDLYTRMGPAAGVVVVDPVYFPLSRMALLRRLHSCIYEASLEEGLEGLRSEYSGLASRLGDIVNRGVKLRLPTLRDSVRSLITSMRQWIQSGLYRIPSPVNIPPWRGRCGEWTPPVEPWRLIGAPEGVVRLSCGGPEEAFDVGECSAPSPISSTMICEGPEGRVAVKDYYRRGVKWIPVHIAGRGYVKYRLTAKARLAAEMIYLPRLRGIAGTPRILGVCLDFRQALMARSYVEGEPLLGLREEEPWRSLGTLLAKIHESSYTLGDTNPGNFVYNGNSVALIDAEQARSYNVRAAAWDLIVLLVTGSFFGVPRELLKAAIEEYSGARPRNEWERVQAEALRPRVWLSLGIVPKNLYDTRRILKEAGRD